MEEYSQCYTEFILTKKSRICFPDIVKTPSLLTGRVLQQIQAQCFRLPRQREKTRYGGAGRGEKRKRAGANTVRQVVTVQTLQLYKDTSSSSVRW